MCFGCGCCSNSTIIRQEIFMNLEYTRIWAPCRESFKCMFSISFARCWMLFSPLSCLFELEGGSVLYSINHHFTWKGKNCSCLLNRLRFTLGVCFPFILFWLAVYHLCLVEEILRRSYIWGVILVWTVSKILDGWIVAVRLTIHPLSFSENAFIQMKRKGPLTRTNSQPSKTNTNISFTHSRKI